MTRAIKKTFHMTWDRDLLEAVSAWMEENGYERGDEGVAAKSLIRLGLLQAPVTAHLQASIMRAYKEGSNHFNQEVMHFLTRLRNEYIEAVRNTTEEDAGQ